MAEKEIKLKDILENCKSILYFLTNEDDKYARQLKYKDFMHKFYQLIDKIPKNSVLKAKGKVDIIIFTVIKNEFKALEKMFPLTEENKSVRSANLNGINAWEVDIERENSRDKLRALIVCIGESGDLECSIVAMRVFQEYNCDLAILCGIAAGLKEEIKKYSVIMSKEIVDYEPQRLESGGKIEYRPKHSEIHDKKLIRDIQSFEMKPDKWREIYKKIVKDYGEIVESEFNIELVDNSELKVGTIASGKKLFADGSSLKLLRKAIPSDKGIIAVEMESAGFCIACKEFKNTWLVIRGISDYGGKDKDDQFNKKYQHIAAFGAFTALLYFLQNHYIRETEPGGAMEDEEF
ncbi:MAG: hypothetical protein LBK58_15570 [Prevotellaceae bacterium]|jgi:nucleoside phosphorylase|nr:hypothetical protein [Prevotellaceae bacterium]